MRERRAARRKTAFAGLPEIAEEDPKGLAERKAGKRHRLLADCAHGGVWGAVLHPAKKIIYIMNCLWQELKSKIS